jgi:hypothetical protein
VPKIVSTRRTAFKPLVVPLARLGEHVPFDATNVAQAPASPGVYLLYRGHRLIYIGASANGDTIRQDLQRHLRGAGGSRTRRATEFDYEAAPDPLPVYWLYLNIYREMTGGLLPDCNQ